MKWKNLFFAFCLLLMISPKLSIGQSFTAGAYYSNSTCKQKTRIEFQVNNNQNGASGLEIRVVVSPTVFNVTDPGDFSPYNGNTIIWTTGIFSFNTHAMNVPKVFCGEVLTPNWVDIHANLYHNGQLIQSLQIPLSSFNQINGTPQPVLLSNLLALPNSPLLSVTDAQTQAQKVHIEGTLIIDTDYSFVDELSSHSEISMGKDARIVVNNEAELRIVGSQVYGCGEIWDAIEVGPGCRLDLIQSIIEDGSTAVLLKTNFDPLGQATEVNVLRSQFTDNDVSILSEESPIGANFINLNIQGSSFREGDINAYAGMVLHDMPQVNVLSSQVGLVFFPVYFEGFKYGVWAENSDIAILGPKILHNSIGIHVENHSTLYVQGWLVGDEFKANYKSIRSIDSDLYVKECDLVETSFGIDISSILAHQTVIEDNYISADKYGIKVFAKEASKGDIFDNIIDKIAETKGYCIYVGGESNTNNDVWDIRSNELYVMEGGLANVHFENAENVHFKENIMFNQPAIPAIKLQGGYNNEIECNQIFDASIGLEQLFSYANTVICNEFDASDIAYQLTGWCDYTTIKGNVLNGSNHDLAFGSQLMPIGIAGSQAPLSLMEQHGNLFEGNGKPQAINFGTPGMVNWSKFYVHSPTNADYLPSFTASTSDWFSDVIPFNGIFSCAQHDCSVPFVGFGKDPRGVDDAIKNNSIQLSRFTSEVQWTGHKHLVRRLGDQKQIDPGFQQYFTQQANSDVGLLAQIKDGVNAVTGFSGPEQQQIDNLYASKDILRQNFFGYVSKANSIDPDSISFYRKAIQTLNDDLRAHWDLKKQSLKTSLPAISAQNAGISTHVTPAHQEKELNELMISLLNTKNFKPSFKQIKQLELLAATCPLAGGDAVFRARAYLALTDSIYDWDDSTACATTGSGRKRLANQVEPDPTITLFPNPAIDRLSIQLAEPVIGSAYLQIISMEGKVQFEITLKAGEQKIQIPVSSWSPAIYMVNVIETNKAPYHAKLIVKHD